MFIEKFVDFKGELHQISGKFMQLRHKHLFEGLN